MKKMILLFIIVLLISGCNKKNYEGYYCNYTEQGVIIVLLDKNVNKDEKNAITKKISEYEGLLSYDLITKEDLATADSNDLYDTYFVYLNSTVNLETYVLELQNTNGVYEATYNNTKSDVSLYNFEGNNYSFGNMIENENSIEGTYKVNKNKIEFDNDSVPAIYIKDDFLCLDEECNKILTKTNELCE